MGQFTEGEITIEAKSKESAKKIAEQIKNLNQYIASKSDEAFITNVSFVEPDGKSVHVVLHSDKKANAEWQCQQILEMMKDLFKTDVCSFTADVTVPENIIYEEFDNE